MTSAVEARGRRIDAARDRLGFATSWGYHSRVSLEHRYVAMTVPKVACTTLKLTLHAFEGLPPADDWGQVHDQDAPRLASFTTAEATEMLTSPDWLRFAFVRDPYDRLFSAWKQKIGNTWDRQYAPLRDRIRSAYGYPVDPGADPGRPPPMVAFAAFARFVAETDDPDVVHDGHWGRQTDILCVDVVDYDVIGRFETFADDFAAVLRRLDAPDHVLALGRQVTNPTTQLPLAAAYDRRLADLVHDLYAPDFAAFGYPRDGWMYHGTQP